MNLRQQIIRSQALSWVLLLVIGMTIFVSVNRHGTFVDQLAESRQEINDLDQIQADVVDLETGLRGYLLTGQDIFLEPFTRARGAVFRDMDAQDANLASDNRGEAGKQKQLLDQARTLLNQWLAEVADPELAAHRDVADPAASLAREERGKQLTDAIRADLSEYDQSEGRNVATLTDDENRALTTVKWITVIGLLGAVVVAALTSLWIANTVARAAGRLAESARRLASGALSERVEKSGARELRQMADAFNEMAAKLESSQVDLAARNSLLSEQASTLARASDIEHTFSDVLRSFTASYDVGVILGDLLRLLAERHGFAVGAIYRYDEWEGALLAAAKHGTAQSLQERLTLQEGVVGQAVLDRRITVLEGDPLMEVNTGLDVVPARATVIVPVYYQERIMGAMALARNAPPDETTLGFLARLGQQLGIALQNLDQYTNLQTLSNQLQERQTEIEAKNRDLERADQLKSEFLTNMSHELRTPLNAIIGFSELLQEQFYGPLNKEQDEYLANIRTSGEHLLGLINDILDLSKIEAGRMELDLEEVKLSQVLESSITIVKEKAHDNGVQISLDAGDTNTITADARKLKQILFNLLSNAVKFTPSGGSVRLTAHTEGAGPRGDMVEIAVADTGAGIRDEDQKKLFREFTQVDGSISRRHEGTGLGLALTKRLVELHGGTISVQSAIGVGSTFTVRLPITNAEPRVPRAEPPATPPQPSTLDTRHLPHVTPLILVVEDDDPTAELVSAYLESAGYETARARNGEEGLTMARELAPNGITLDMMMPVLDGWTFLERAAADAELSRIPVIVLSVASDLKHGWSLGASVILRKPVRRDELFAALIKVNIMPNGAKPARVLVVDDDPKAVEIVSDYLTSFGHQVHKAYGGAQGVDAADDEHPDLVILDLMMPEVSGFTVVEKLHENPRTADIPIIILTAKIVSPDERRRLNGHIVSIVEKSGINRAAFLSEVNRAVRPRAEATRSE